MKKQKKNILKFLSPLPVLAIHSTSGVASKDWPFFQELVVALGQDKFEIVQVGGRGDKPVVGAFDLRGKWECLIWQRSFQSVQCSWGLTPA
jgi:hypothetical protein